jgi:hypothetical protein
MSQDKKVSIYDPGAGAFREVSVEKAINHIREAKKLEKELIAQGVLKQEVPVEGN